MKMRIFAAAAAVICAVSCVSCKSGKEASFSVSENSIPESGVGELITPEEGSAEYNLGQYRMSSSGVKLYYDEEEVPQEVVLALESYFLSFQNNDFESYKASLFPDYAERYEKFLQDEYNYQLDSSFALSREKLSNIIKNEHAEHAEHDTSSATESESSGEFKITRIKVQRPGLSGNQEPEALMPAEETTEATTQSMEELEKQAFSYFNEIFGLDYYEFVKKNSDDLEYLNFYIYASDEDGEEYPLVGDIDIVFAVKDGKYYTFG